MSKQYLTVTALTRYIKRKIDMDNHLSDVWIMGEISNFKHHNRGHMYLTIKDEQTRVQSVMFSGKNRYLKFTPENGMKVLIRGDISVFESFGQYQLYIHQMEPDGIGSLFLAYEQLKEKLAKQGYFNDDHKQPLPDFPEHIGIITSPTGAAVRDIISTIKRRYPIVDATILPVLVQGEKATDSIVKAIEMANEMNYFDVLIIGRGGGSIEELWSFNEERVAKAIYTSKIPVISAVGHETDTTISDFVADYRAPTPTGAAEIVVPSINVLNDRISDYTRRLTGAINQTIKLSDKSLSRLNQSYAFRYPEQLIRQKELELDKLMERLDRITNKQIELNKQDYTKFFMRLISQHPDRQLKESNKALQELNKQFDQTFTRVLERKSTQLTTALDKLSLLNPLEIMKRGFAIPYTGDREIINTKEQVRKQDIIHLEIADGELKCEVLKIEEK